MDQFGSRTADEDYTGLLKRMKKRPLDFFKMFYGDTSVNGSPSAIRCGLDFFGVDHVLFGTDCPFDPEGGPLFVRETIKALDTMALKPGDRRKIYFGNAMNMLRLSEAKPAKKAELYASLGLQLTYRPAQNLVAVEAAPVACAKVRVGGGT